MGTCGGVIGEKTEQHCCFCNSIAASVLGSHVSGTGLRDEIADVVHIVERPLLVIVTPTELPLSLLDVPGAVVTGGTVVHFQSHGVLDGLPRVVLKHTIGFQLSRHHPGLVRLPGLTPLFGHEILRDPLGILDSLHSLPDILHPTPYLRTSIVSFRNIWEYFWFNTDQSAFIDL